MWMPVDLAWQPDPLRGAQMRHRGTVGGGTIVFWKLTQDAEAEAFLAATPDPALGFGTRGQLVLVADGKPHRLLVDDLVGQPRSALGGTDLLVELTDFNDQLAAARLKVRRGADDVEIHRDAAARQRAGTGDLGDRCLPRSHLVKPLDHDVFREPGRPIVGRPTLEPPRRIGRRLRGALGRLMPGD
jgi:hypothetical protein